MKMPLTAAVTCLLVTAPGCTPRDGDGATPTICFAFQDLETGFWVAAHEIITSTLESKGFRVLERNANQDANRQLEQVRSAMAQGVDGIIIIPQDGQSAVTIVGEANRAGIPIAVFNRPPTDRSHRALVVVADNRAIAGKAVDFLVEEAGQRSGKSHPCVLVGDLGDPNSVARKEGFYAALAKHPERFEEVVEVETKWDPGITQANLEATLRSHPEIDLIFTSSDFLYPQIRAVLEPLGKWKRRGEKGHVLLGGLDGDKEACRLMKEGYVDSTGVQDLYFEADKLLGAILEAIEKGEKTPERWIDDPGFALTQGNLAEREADMWGCRLLGE